MLPNILTSYSLSTSGYVLCQKNYVLADILNQLTQIDQHEVIHKRLAFARLAFARLDFSDVEWPDVEWPDVEWNEEFGKNKDASFLTCDTNILNRPIELAAFRQTPITGFWLKSKSWRKYLKHRQLHILAGKILSG